MPLTFEPSISAPDAAGFFSNSELAQEDADRAAMGWQDRIAQIDSGDLGEVDPQERVQLIDGLTKYRDFKNSSGHKLFSHRDIVTARRKAQDVDKNLEGWNQLFSEEGFEAALEKRGLLVKYQRMAKMTGDSESAREIYRRKVFLKEYVGRADETFQENVGRNLFNLKDTSNASFTQAAQKWVQENRAKQVRAMELVKSATLETLSGSIQGLRRFKDGTSEIVRGPDHFAATRRWAGAQAQNEEERAVIMRAIANTEKEYRNILPLIEEMSAAASREMAKSDKGGMEGLKPANGSFPRWVFERYESLGQEGRQKVWSAMAALAAEADKNEEGSGDIFYRSLDRGFRTIGRGIGDFLTGEDQREAEEVLKNPNASASQKADANYTLGKVRFYQDMNNLEEMFLKAKPVGFWQEAASMAGGTIPTLVSFVNPVSALATGMGYAGNAKRKFIQENPNLSQESAATYGYTSGLLQFTAERVQFSFLKGVRIPGAATFKTATSEYVKRVAAGVAAEVGTEYLQEISHDFVANVASQIDDNVKAGDISKTTGQFIDHVGPMAVVMLPLVMMGAGIQVRTDSNFSQDFGWQLQNEDVLQVAGFSAEQAKAISGMETDFQRASEFRRLWDSRKGGEVSEEIAKRAQQAITDFAEGKTGAQEQAEGQPQISAQEEGFVVRYPDDSPEVFETMEGAEASVAAYQAAQETENAQIQDIRDVQFSEEEQGEVQRELEEAMADIGGPDFMASGGSSLTADSDFDLDSPESEITPLPIAESQAALQDIKGSVESAIGFDLSGQKWTVRPADGSGKANDTRGTTGLARAVAGVFGRQLVVFDSDSPPPFRGLFNTNHADKVFVWGDADKPHLTLTGHELAHAIQTQTPELWTELTARLDKEFVRLDQLAKEKIGYREGELKAEAIGDFLGDNMASKEFWEGLAIRQPKIFGKLAGVVMSFLDSVIAKLKKAGFQSDRWFRDVSKARGILADTVAEFGRRVNNEGGSTVRSEGDGPNLFSLTRDSQLQFALSKQLGRSRSRIDILTRIRGQVGRMMTEAPNQKRLEELRVQEADLKKEIREMEAAEIVPGEREESLKAELAEELERIEMELSVLDQAFGFDSEVIDGDLEQTLGDIAENVVAEYAARIEDGNLSETQKAKLVNEAKARLTERKISARKLAAKDKEIARRQISKERQSLRSEADLLRSRIGGKISMEQGKTRLGQRAKVRALKARLAQVQSSMKARSLRSDMAIMSSMVGILPANMRGKITGMGKLAQLTSEAARAKQLSKIANQFGDVIETELKAEYTKKIRKVIDQSTAKADKTTRRRKSKIGPSAHLIGEAATDAMARSAEESQGLADGIRRDFDLKENPTFTEMEEAEGRALAYELFADFQNADAARMERMVDFLNLNYSEGRKEWLTELQQRKTAKDSRVEKMRESIGSTDFTDFPEISRSNAKKNSVKGFFQELASFYQMTDFIAERSNDPETRQIVGEMQDAFRQARNSYADNLDAEQDAITESISEILGVKSGVNQFARLNGKLVKLSKPREVKATFLAGRKSEDISVSKDVVEAVIRQEVGGVDGVEFSKSDREALEISWEKFLELPSEVQARKKNVTFERVTSQGVRKTLGKLSQLDLAKEWLALQQTDARAKYAKGGWDERTAEEIQAEMEPEVLEVARWMQNYLRENTPEVDAIHRQEYGLALASVENYFPLLFNVVNNDSQISMDGNNVAVSARKGSFLKSRVTHAAMPKQANALAVLQSHVASVEFWKTHAPVMREWGAVLRDQKFQHAMQAKMGPEFTQNLNNWLKLIEANGRDQTMIHLEADKLIQKFQGGLALSVLGGRIRTVLVNMTAALNVTFEVPLTKLFKGLRPEVFGDVVTLAKSPTFQRRLKSGGSYEATVALEQRLGGGMTATTLRRAGQIVMQPINFADTLTNLSTALAYRAQVVENRKSGMSEKRAQEQALDYVDEIITRVAQPTDALSRSLFENKRRGGIGGLLFLFASEARKNTSLMGLAARKVITGKGKQSRAMASQQLIMGTLAYTALGYILKSAVQAFTKDEGGEDPGERFMGKMTDTRAITHTVATEHLRGIPLLGDAWNASMATVLNNSGIEGEKIPVWDSSSNPLMRPVKGAKAGIKILEAENADELADALIDTIQGVGSLVPETAIFSQVANVAEDSLGFMRATLGDQLSDDQAQNVLISKLKKRKEEILSEDREAMKEAKGRERRLIEAKRKEGYLEELIKWRAEVGPEQWGAIMQKLRDAKTFPGEVLDSLDEEGIR